MKFELQQRHTDKTKISLPKVEGSAILPAIDKASSTRQNLRMLQERRLPLPPIRSKSLPKTTYHTSELELCSASCFRMSDQINTHTLISPSTARVVCFSVKDGLQSLETEVNLLPPTINPASSFSAFPEVTKVIRSYTVHMPSTAHVYAEGDEEASNQSEVTGVAMETTNRKQGGNAVPLMNEREGCVDGGCMECYGYPRLYNTPVSEPHMSAADAKMKRVCDWLFDSPPLPVDR